MTLRCGYGTYVPAHAEAAAELREEIGLAEGAGFDAIFYSEHHGVDGYAPDPLALATFALGRTTRLRAGPMPLLLPLRNPALVAETAGLAHFISDGRLILGLGTGYHPQDFDQVGAPIDERGTRFAEGLRTMRRVWAGQEHDGTFYRVKQSAAPLHRWSGGDPPIWIASSSSIGMKRAARWAQGIMLSSISSAAELRPVIDEYRRACADAGSAVGTIGVIRRCWFGASDETEAFISGFLAQLETATHAAEYATKEWVQQRHTRSFLDDVLFVGDAARVGASVSRWARAIGADYVMLKLTWGKRDFAKLRTQLERAKGFIAALA